MPAPGAQPSRNTTGEVTEFIINDLNDAEELFALAGTTTANAQFANSDTVKALRARIALFTGDLATAETDALDLLGRYSLVNDPSTTAGQTTFNNLWEDLTVTNPELIFELARTPGSGGNGPSRIWNTNTSDVGGAPLYEMSRSIFNILDANATSFGGDLRRNRYVDDSSIISADYDNTTDPINEDVIIVDKYPGRLDLSEPLINDIKIFRTVDFHFILAEVYARRESTQSANQIKIVRDARYFINQNAPNYANLNEALTDILLERRIELFSEGHRYIDFRRIGVELNLTYDRNATDCTLVADPTCNLPASDVRTQYLPIPLNELRANPQ